MFKIFVGNLGQQATEDDVRALFERHALINDIAIPQDEKGKLRGFAIVMIKDPQQGRLALMAARGSRLHGRMLIINQARKKGAAPPKRGSRRSSFRTRASGMYGVRQGPGAGGGGGFGSRPPREGGSERGPAPGADRDRSGPGFGSGGGRQGPGSDRGDRGFGSRSDRDRPPRPRP
jgi:RNA recognition motif-containing protein